MKILQLMMRAGPGSIPYTHYTALWRRRHRVTVCTFWPGQAAGDRQVQSVCGTGSMVSFGKQLRALLRARSFDLVHIHAPRLGAVLLVLALVSRRRLLSRTVLHVHGSYASYSRTDRWLLTLLCLCCARIVCGGHAVRRSMPKRVRRCAGRRLRTIRHGVDLDLIDRVWPIRPATEWTEPPPLSLVTVGRLTATKNHATILRGLAQARSRSARLTVIGDGPLRQPLQALAADLQLAHRVDFLGTIPHAQTLRRLWDADGFVSMALQEGLPQSVLEAMGCFCPVVLSDIAPHREIRGRRADLIPLLPPTDPAALARAIDAWDAMPADVRRCWGADCRLHVEPRFALTRTLRKLDRLAEELAPTITPEWAIFCRCIQAGGGRAARGET